MDERENTLMFLYLPYLSHEAAWKICIFSRRHELIVSIRSGEVLSTFAHSMLWKPTSLRSVFLPHE